MNNLATYSDITCGEACWTAKEDICKCSCNGANHGCLRITSGIQPQRTSKIRNTMMYLSAVGSYGQLTDTDRRLISFHKEYLYSLFGIVFRKASKSEIERWPELTFFRNLSEINHRWRDEAYLIWTRNNDYTPDNNKRYPTRMISHPPYVELIPEVS